MSREPAQEPDEFGPPVGRDGARRPRATLEMFVNYLWVVYMVAGIVFLMYWLIRN